MENTQNIFTGKTVEEAVETALAALGIKKEDAQITVVDEGKKGIFGIGGSKAKVKVEKRATDGERAVKFIDGLFDILKINAVSEIVSDSEMPEVKAYPNPVAETLVIENPSSGSYDWQICTLDGKQALNGKGTAGKTAVDCSALTAGEYILTVISGYGQQSAVIIKK